MRTSGLDKDRELKDLVSEGPPIAARIIEPRVSWQVIDFRELWEYRDLLYFLVWRDVKTRYAQSVLGIGWAIIQPVFFMIVFTIVFGMIPNHCVI